MCKFKAGDVVTWSEYCLKEWRCSHDLSIYPAPFVVVDVVLWDRNRVTNERYRMALRLACAATGEVVNSQAEDGRWYWEWVQIDPYLTAVYKARHARAT